ncbi:hypothetical protein C2G38_2182034 [Gigaspora rosea]|uniref:NrS-1 polymerase-like helicase domain-containing protein n=1 Tax=Gigaspora rosea TaxID=44941 RepID=A0A397VDG0_9GLOM|nr:hypothetical protein C2G38_2182034 [Gigaspora rosea]
MDPILWYTKNIISNGDKGLCKKVFGSEFFYAASDLGKILGQFNSCIQTRKLIVMNKTDMSWHKYNNHLKLLITENYLIIEHKGLEPKVIKDYTRFMVLTKVLEHPKAPSVVMAYLLSLDLSNWSPQEIPSTKIKVDIIHKQLPNPVRLIIDLIATWAEDSLVKLIAEKKFSQIAKFCESGLGNIKEFSDTPQPDLPINEPIDIPIFDVPEIISQKTAPSQQVEAPVASIFGTTKASKLSESVIDKLKTIRLFESIEPISKIVNTLSKEADSLKSSEVSFAILLSRAQQEEHLRKRATKLGENQDYVKEAEEDPKEYINMSQRADICIDSFPENWSIQKSSTPKERRSEAKKVNICQISDSTCSEETIKEIAQHIVQNNLTKKDIKAISRTLVETSPDAIVFNASEKIISAILNPEVIRLSNKVQKDCSEQHKNEGIDFSDHFSLESVKGKIGWEAIISEKLKDPGIYILKCISEKDKFIGKLLLPSSLYKLGAVFASVAHRPKNASKANTYTSEALKHSSDNYTSLSKRYTIVNMQRRGEPYNQTRPFCIFNKN